MYCGIYQSWDKCTWTSSKIFKTVKLLPQRGSWIPSHSQFWNLVIVHMLLLCLGTSISTEVELKKNYSKFVACESYQLPLHDFWTCSWQKISYWQLALATCLASQVVHLHKILMPAYSCQEALTKRFGPKFWLINHHQNIQTSQKHQQVARRSSIFHICSHFKWVT